MAITHRRLALPNVFGEWHDFVDGALAQSFTGKVRGSVLGNTEQRADYVYADGMLTQAGTPTPSDPIYPATNIPAGTYKINCPDGIYEFTLADDVRGLTGAQDRVVFDRISKQGWRDTRIVLQTLTGAEIYAKNDTTGKVWRTTLPGLSWSSAGWTTALCSHFKQVPGATATLAPGIAYGKYLTGCYIMTSDVFNEAANMAAWVAAFYNAGNAIKIYYPLATPVRTTLTFTLVTSSTAPEFPASALTVVNPSPDYMMSLYHAGGCNLISRNADASQQSVIALPLLRKVGTVADTLEYKGAGMWEHTQWIDVMELNGAEAWKSNGTYVGGVRLYPSTPFAGYKSNGDGLCSHLTKSINVSSPGIYFGVSLNVVLADSYSITLSANDAATNIALWKSYLSTQYAAGTPVTVAYQLATPIVTQLALGELKTYAGTTNIIQDTDDVQVQIALQGRAKYAA